MGEASFWERLHQEILSHPLLSTGVVIGVLALCYGIFLSLPRASEEIVIHESQETTQIKTAMQVIMVDISGAVMKPGVYSLPDGARIKDILEKAGGLHPDADQQRVQKELNLAQKVADAAKLYIPFKGDQTSVTGQQTVLGASSTLVNLNTATSSELESLPKVGGVTAKKIIDNRPYTEIKDLLNKKVVGSAVYSEIEALVSAP